jgi:excisionase family DNA binding protein
MSILTTGRSDWESRPILPAQYDGRVAFPIPEVGEILGISRWSAYEAAKRGDLPVIKIGRRKLVPRRALEKLLSSATAPWR